MATEFSPEQIRRIEEYIRINHEYEHTTELARSLKIPRTRVVFFCKKLNITPISTTGLMVQYFAENKNKQTLTEMALHLETRLWYLQKVLKKAGIDYKEQDCKKKKAEPLKEPSCEPKNPTIDITPEICSGVADLFAALDLKMVEVGNGNIVLYQSRTEKRIARRRNITIVACEKD